MEQCLFTNNKISNFTEYLAYYEYSITHNGIERLFRISKEGTIELSYTQRKIFVAMLDNNEWPIEEETIITSNLISQIIRLGDYPKDFESKTNYFLLKFYQNGGKEYKRIEVKRIKPSFAYAEDEDELQRIVKGLVSSHLVEEINGEIVITNEGIEEAKKVESFRIHFKTPKVFDKPKVMIVAAEGDSFYLEKIKTTFLGIGFTVTCVENVKDENSSPTVNNFKSYLLKGVDYVVFLSSDHSDRNLAFGSMVDIAIERHQNELILEGEFLYFAILNDKPKGRPRIEDYFSSSYESRIISSRLFLLRDLIKDWNQKKKPSKNHVGIGKKLQEYEIKWLRLVLGKFVQNQRLDIHRELLKHSSKFPENFNPRNIDETILKYGAEITLYGISIIDSNSVLLNNFEIVINAIKNILRKIPNIELITSDQVIAISPELTHKEIHISFRLLMSNGFASSMGSSTTDNSSHITVKSEDLRAYRSFTTIGEFLFGKFEKTTDVESDNPSGNRLEIGKTDIEIRDRNDIDLVLGVQELAKELANILKFIPSERGTMVGIFGRWGRGKSVFLEEIWKEISTESKYHRIDYHAWKYQETPASWAYLYENISDVYYNMPSFKWRFWIKPSKWYIVAYIGYLFRVIKLNLQRLNLFDHLKWISIVVLGGLSVVGLLKFNVAEFKSFNWIGVSAIVTGALTFLINTFKDYGTEATNLISRFGLKVSYSESMGIQAEIHKELLLLLRVWIPEKSNKKAILFVEDIDRCSEEKIVQIVDSLRIILDDDEIAKRLMIVAAIDEKILQHAISLKYDDLSEDILEEYLDKLFILGIKLNPLNGDERLEYLRVLSKKDIHVEKMENVNLIHDDKTIVNLTSGKLNIDSSMPIQKTPESTYKPATIKIGPQKTQKIFPEELNALEEIVATWSGATPRKIRIMYYRYLLTKRILMNRYSQMNKENPWLYENNLKHSIRLLVDLNVKDIENERENFINFPNESLYTKSKLTHINQTDYLELLSVIEMVKAY